MGIPSPVIKAGNLVLLVGARYLRSSSTIKCAVPPVYHRKSVAVVVKSLNHLRIVRCVFAVYPFVRDQSMRLPLL